MAQKKTTGNGKPRKAPTKKRAKPDPKPETADITESRALTVQEREERDAAIFRGKCLGLMDTTLAETYGVSVATVQRVCQVQRRAVRKGVSLRAVDIFDEYMLQLDAMIDQLARISSSTGAQAAVKVSAIGKRLEVLREKREALVAVNAFPKDMGQVGNMLDNLQMAQAITNVLDSAGVDDEVLDKIIDLLDPAPGGVEQIEGVAEDVTDAEVVEDEVAA